MDNEEIQEEQEIQENTQADNERYSYDGYYYEVLNKMDTIIKNEEIICKNEEKIIEQNSEIISSFNFVIFLLVIVFVYTYLRNMIILKK